MSLPNQSLFTRLLPFTLALALAGMSLLGCGREAPTAAAGPEPETALDHAKKHLDPAYVCPMHPQVVSSEPGECPICGMDLVVKEADAATAAPAPETPLEHAKKHLDPAYVCPMHPQVVSSEPGECPICGMDLVVKEAEAATDPGAQEAITVTVPDAVVNQLGVRTAAVRRGTLTRHIEGFGAFVGSASRGYRPANRPSDPNLSDPGASPSVLVAQVFEREAPLLHQGQVARVRFPSLGAREWKGTVTGVETQISPTTRTLQFRVSVDLEGASVPGGMTAMVTLEVDPVADVLLVPREAVIMTGKGARVILAQGGGRFQPREVEAEDLGEDDMVIRSGLQEGEQVVVSAQFLLDSEANLQAGLSRLTGGQTSDPSAQEGAMHEVTTPQGAMHKGTMQ